MTNNVLYHPNHDILIESNVDRVKTVGIRDNSKVLKVKIIGKPRKDPGLENYDE